MMTSKSAQIRFAGCAAACFVALALGGCAETGIGDPCSLEVEPSEGFTSTETAIEVDSIQCRTRACLAYNEQSFCTRRCEKDSDCLADWNEQGPGQGDEPRAYCEATVKVGSEAIQGRYCVPRYASKEH